ncbi:unnamed protein product, partial [Prorocentrum cordatum]
GSSPRLLPPEGAAPSGQRAAAAARERCVLAPPPSRIRPALAPNGTTSWVLTRQSARPCCPHLPRGRRHRNARGDTPRSERLEAMMLELFHLHDLNGNGRLEEVELVKLNEKIAILHQGRDADRELVRERYRGIFRAELDARGEPVQYWRFREYMFRMLDRLDPDEPTQAMILDQFIWGADLALSAFPGSLKAGRRGPGRGGPDLRRDNAFGGSARLPRCAAACSPAWRSGRRGCPRRRSPAGSRRCPRWRGGRPTPWRRTQCRPTGPRPRGRPTRPRRRGRRRAPRSRSRRARWWPRTCRGSRRRRRPGSRRSPRSSPRRWARVAPREEPARGAPERRPIAGRGCAALPAALTLLPPSLLSPRPFLPILPSSSSPHREYNASVASTCNSIGGAP